MIPPYEENIKFTQIAHKIDPYSKLLRVWELEGGVSARVTALEIEHPGGQAQKMIVRQYGDAELKSNPRVAAGEFHLLQFLQAAGLAAPVSYYLDQSGEIFSTPYIVTEYIEGKTEFAPADLDDYTLQFTTYLSSVHHLDCSNLDLSLLPPVERKYTGILSNQPDNVDESLDEGHIRDVLEVAWPLPRRNAPALLHGDFWPGNILWKDGQLLAVIDWEDAVWGDPLADLANSRLELLWAFGIDAMQSFTRQYRSMTTIDFANLPYWDLCVALRRIPQFEQWGLDEATVQTMRERLRWFVARAFEQLSGQ
jgi:aminoglycoside phosphotransferase (APT) family kinase protein